MKDRIDTLIDEITALRSEVFKLGDEKGYRLLGRAIGNLIEARDGLK